jgi:hypothetical protein
MENRTMNLLFWITNSVEQAVLKGFAQAIAKLGIDADDSDPLAAIAARIDPKAIEADETKPVKKR